MTQRDDLDQLLSAWVDDPYTPPAPRYLGNVLERTRTTRQRPAWASLERWLPMADKVLQPTTAPPMRLAWLLLIALLVVALRRWPARSSDRGSSARLHAIPTRRRGRARVRVRRTPDAGRATSTPCGPTVRTCAELTSAASASGSDQAPALSPDGTRIAFRATRSREHFVVVIDAAGGNRTTLWATTRRETCRLRRARRPRVVTGRADHHLRRPAWRAPANPTSSSSRSDGSAPGDQAPRHPARTASSRGSRPTGRGSPSWAAMAAAPGPLRGRCRIGRRRCGRAPGPSDRTGSRRAARGTSGSRRNGRLMARSSRSRSRIARGEGPRSSSSRPTVRGSASWRPARSTTPRWSPDGKRLAFHRMVDPSEYWKDRPCTMRVWVIDADGTDERRLDPLVDGCVLPPIWSPDGTRLVEPADRSDELFHLGVVAADGDEPAGRLPSTSYGASWQPVAAPLPPAPSFSATP